jgi:tetratricopeptide (TPR) repeat protein
MAMAEETLFPIIDLDIGETVRVERHPTVRQGMVEVVIRGCHEDLAAVLTGRTNPYVSGMDVTYSGSGVWILKSMMSRRDVDLRVLVDGGRLKIDVVESLGGLDGDEKERPTVRSLVDGTAPTSVANTTFPTLMFLHGEAMSYGMTSRDFIPLLPSPASLPRSTWAAIDRARQAVLNASTKVSLAQARYELGWLYLEKGFDREARYYFEYLATEPGALPARDVALARARAALACQHWDQARERLREAYRFGARESAVVEGFGVVSLATGVPGRSLTSRVLSHVTGRPEALLLAAELLQRDGYYKESRPLLEALTGRATGRTARQIALRLGDARTLDGEYDSAVRAYRDAPRALGDFRIKLVELLEKGPSDWAKAVPGFTALASQGGEVGAEALYLLSQLDGMMGSQVDAVTDLSRLIRNHRRVAMRSDVPERLWTIYKERQTRLLAAEKWFDVAALHEGAWHPMVRRAVDDHDLLMGIARAYEEIGLSSQALRVTQEVFPMILAAGIDDKQLVYDLARLYGETGNAKEGLRTLRYLKGKPGAEGVGGVAMLRADLLEQSGDIEGAMTALRRALKSAKHRDQAAVRIARIDAEAGRCREASGVLWGKLMTPAGQKKFVTPRPYLALARCMAAQGEGEMAAEAARLAAARTDSAEESRFAEYIAAASRQFPEGASEEVLGSGGDIWAALSEDHKAGIRLSEEIEKRKQP